MEMDKLINGLCGNNTEKAETLKRLMLTYFFYRCFGKLSPDTLACIEKDLLDLVKSLDYSILWSLATEPNQFEKDWINR